MIFGDVSSLPGIGPKRVEALHTLGISRVIDLLTHIPRRYEDRRIVTPIARLRLKDDAIIAGTISEISSKRPRPKLTVNRVLLSDETGSIIVTFFNQDYILSRAEPGQRWAVYGRCDRFARDRIFSLKEIDLHGSGEALDLGTIRPYYPATSATPQTWMRRTIRELLARPVDDGAPVYEEQPVFSESLRMVHRPRTFEETESGRKRLALDELVTIRLSVEKALRARPPITRAPPVRELNISLPFSLTAAQEKIRREIIDDLEAPRPMRRLVEGDVGSGKTVLAILAAAHVAERNQKTVFLSPTEILAEQHFRAWCEALQKIGMSPFLLTGSTAKDVRREIFAAAAGDEAAVFFGTHALFSEKLVFQDLGLVVIDEQQRFGVLQRDRIVKKSVDMLALSATPIPRTLAMTVYGDLSISTLAERLPGRAPVETIHLVERERKKMMPLIRATLGRGERVYIVYPLIEDDESSANLRNVTAQHKKIKAAFPNVGTAVLTGATKSKDKEAAMRKFRDGEIAILVATSVVEVGLDVPEATLMIVEHAEHYGLAQLHQLRGRVGRGRRPGICVLTTGDEIGEYASARIEALLETTDGFRIAEEDLRLRGPGEMLGERQSGGTELRVARLGVDAELVPKARDIAGRMLDDGAPPEFFERYIETFEQRGAGVT